jgi:hypothetical protein
MLAGCLVPLVFLPTAVVFCMWMHRSYKNLLEMGTRGLSYSPGWAAGAFFVPFLNLVRPCQIAQEMWRASRPGRREDEGRGWRSASASPVVGAWWACCLIATIVSYAASRTRWAVDFEDTGLFPIFLVKEGFWVAAALFAILMVRRLRARQEAKLDVLLGRA